MIFQYQGKGLCKNKIPDNSSTRVIKSININPYLKIRLFHITWRTGRGLYQLLTMVFKLFIGNSQVYHPRSHPLEISGQTIEH